MRRRLVRQHSSKPLSGTSMLLSLHSDVQAWPASPESHARFDANLHCSLVQLIQPLQGH